MQMRETRSSRADLHCHSTASAMARLGVQRALGLPECATPPEEVYELAKRRGMDFVTITDHDTIDGALSIADRPDVFLSEELTTWFKGEPQAVHVLCFGITPDDHEWLQANRLDVERCAAYLHEHEISSALAHPFYSVAAPLAPRHRRRLAELFPVWETRNGSRARELNMPAAVYIETHGGTGVGGSDDHAGVDVGRTFTETAPATTPEEFLARIRSGQASARGEQGGAAKWAHAAVALALRVAGTSDVSALDPRSVLSIVERVVSDGQARSSSAGTGVGPNDARALLGAWLETMGLEPSREGVLAMLQADEFTHAGLFRRARRAHERSLRRAVEELGATTPDGPGNWAAAGATVLRACVPAIPYAPAMAFLAREKAKLATRDDEPRRVALVADGIGGMHGVTHTLDEIRERGVPGYEVEVVGTDPGVDRRLATVSEVDIPLYPGLAVGVPSLPAIVEAIADGRYDLVHLCSPGPAGVGAALVGRLMGVPAVGSYHTELAAYAGLRSGDERMELAVRAALSVFYGHCDTVLSPSPSADESLRALGVPGERVERWERGVDTRRFGRTLRTEREFSGEVNVMYAGRLTREKGMDLLADAFLAARERDPRLHLVLAGGGPEEGELRRRLGEHATFLGWLEGEDLARAYASADLFLFASRTDTFGQVLLEAQASGLPVVAVAEGGPRGLIDDGRTGRLCPPDAAALAAAVVALAGDPAARRRMARAAEEAVATRGWDHALRQLGAGYARALSGPAGLTGRRAA